MPPRELPGFYFDTERNRYFPLASRPPQTRTDLGLTKPTPDVQEPSRPTRRRRVLWSYTGETTSAGRAREASRLLHARLASTQRGCVEQVRSPWTFGSTQVSAFRTTPTRQFLGDTHGWLHSRTRVESSSSRCRDAEDESDGWAEWSPWTSEVYLGMEPDSEISAICTTSTHCVAVCFGPATKICIQQAGMPGRTTLLDLSAGSDDLRTALLNLPAVTDVRAASLHGRTLVLGAARNAVLLPDLDASTTAVRLLPTRTDVFAVAQQENLVYAGTRTGAMLRFDTRTTKSKAQVLFESGAGNGNTGLGVNPGIQRSSTVFVQPTHGGQALVVGYMDGRLATYDLRFVRPAAPPVVTYSGNPSALLYNGRLGITLDPAERFLFAAGADCRLRAWSLDSGAPVKPHALNSSLNSNSASSFNSAPPSQTSRNPFIKVFPAPLAALQVVNDDGEPAPMLWAGGGGEMWHWRLGV
ncbi:hypothetical protein B0H13DRAFT_2137165 [Mycena leptocephala]|nr:hypothetical protein B0H13DRAFT_2137165 [Mycena leptocephala]